MSHLTVLKLKFPTIFCHAELADLRTDGVEQVRIANRLSGMHGCAKSETL